MAQIGGDPFSLARKAMLIDRQPVSERLSDTL
jgi:hypothetical protein